MILPELYRYGRERRHFGLKLFTIYMLEGVTQVRFRVLTGSFDPTDNCAPPNSPPSYSSSFTTRTIPHPLEMMDGPCISTKWQQSVILRYLRIEHAADLPP